MKSAAVYARLSQERGEEVSVPIQIAECRKRAASLGYEVPDSLVFADRNISASKRGTRRPAFEQLVEGIRVGRITAVFVREQSRFYRQPRELEDLIVLVEDGQCRIHSLFEGEVDLTTASGRMQARIRVSVDKQESERLSERIRMRKAVQREQGLDLGGGRRRFGYRRVPGNGWEVDRAEAAVVREAAQRVLAGESLSRISADLNERGVGTGGGGRWRPSHLRRILTGRESKRGTSFVLGGANWPAILTEDEAELLSARLTGPSKRGPKPLPRGVRYPLTGLMECSECGTKMAGSGSYYRCNGRDGGCRRVSVLARAVEDLLEGWIQAEREHGRARAEGPPLPEGDPEEQSSVLKELRRLDGRVGELEAELDDAETQTTRQAIYKQLDRLHARRVELSKRLGHALPGPRRGRFEQLLHVAEHPEELEDWDRRRGAGELTATEVMDLHESYAAYFRRIVVRPRGERRGRARDAGLDPARIDVEWNPP